MLQTRTWPCKSHDGKKKRIANGYTAGGSKRGWKSEPGEVELLSFISLQNREGIVNRERAVVMDINLSLMLFGEKKRISGRELSLREPRSTLGGIGVHEAEVGNGSPDEGDSGGFIAW